ncbi:MAG: hypothetical protein Q3M24_14645 [Candidatus Electrothrix aestuarii]|uniref:Uncharacterized protein n=1 Tax=Candidatus Electrothrix aestuarii TaxID=3062594 RepID=A0AAU8LPY1_9BACT|nr:hypothetical protein [Candidatus Electrothrix aestuarii]
MGLNPQEDSCEEIKFNLIQAMSFEVSLPGYERLNTIVVSLGMEISDSILLALRNEVAACRAEQKEQLGIVGPVLQGIEAVARHIDEIRLLTDARALHLLQELVQTYKVLTEEKPEESVAWSISSEALNKVLSWQHGCVRESLNKAQSPDYDGIPTTPQSSSFDMRGMLDAVRQEIAETGMLAIRESATILELVHGQKEVQEAQEGEASADSEKSGAGKDKDFSAVVRENISSLQQALHQEMGRLRHDFIGDR